MSGDLETSVTIKYPEQKRYEGAPWAVFKGGTDQIRHQIIAYFGYDQSAVQGMTLHELVLLANQAVRASGAVQGILGGSPVAQTEQPAASGPTGESVWDQVDGEAGGQQKVAGQQQEENPNLGLIGLLKAAESIEELKRLWATNKAAFDAADVQEAYSARGKALKAAASS